MRKLSALLKGITAKHHGDFCCLNCLHTFATENKRESHKKVCENKDFCNVVMPSKEIPQEVLILFHNESYDYHCIIKELVRRI